MLGFLLCLLLADPGFRQVAEPIPAAAETYDVHGNLWTLAGGDPPLQVSPAQEPESKTSDTVTGLRSGPWKYLAADEHGFLWLASATELLRLETILPARGWESFSNDPAFPKGEITALGAGPSGSMMVALDTGKLVEVDRPNDRTVIRVEDAPPGVSAIRTDGEGRLWLRAGGKVYRKDAPPDAWQRNWVLAARMPWNNHDLSGDVLNGRFYMAGGVTSGWGFPPRHHLFEELYEFDPGAAVWRIAAKLGVPRGYNATSVLDGRVWVIGGDMETGDRRVAVNTVQICDPATGAVDRGPELPIAVPMPLAVHINGRIYVAGSEKDRYAEPGKLFSIGSGEKHWRREPDGPPGMSALAGTAHEGKFYIMVPHRSLAIFDTETHKWAEVIGPKQPRSGQVAAYRGEIWLMGGAGVRDRMETLIYNPKIGTWRQGPDLPRPLAWGAAAVVNGRLMVTGGAGGRCYNDRTFYLREREGKQ